MAMRVVLSCEELRHLYQDEGLSMARIAACLGCSAATISNRLRACGIAARPGHFKACVVPQDLLEQLYRDESLTVAVIAAQLAISVGTLHNRRRAYGIPSRTRRQRR